MRELSTRRDIAKRSNAPQRDGSAILKCSSKQQLETYVELELNPSSIISESILVSRLNDRRPAALHKIA